MPFSLDNYLDSFLNWEARLSEASSSDMGLERVQALLEAVGHPENSLKFVHVAGSKGKGSTCLFLANILRSAGYRVGLFTSPHLFSHCERIRVLEPGGVPSDFEGMILLSELEERMKFYSSDVDRLRASGVKVTYFELWTAMALTYFVNKKVDIVILETGLGGRLDATNALDTMVCGITPIGMEHVAILGPTLRDIAGEKAGIVKMPSQRVVLAVQKSEVMDVLQARCQKFGIRPTVIGEDMVAQILQESAEGTCFSLQGRRDYGVLKMSLVGEHQVNNAVMAIAMAEDVEPYGFLLTAEAVREGVAATRWPARFEIVHRDPRVIIDCAHTPESAEALVVTFQKLYPGQKAVVVLGMSADKDGAGILQAVCPLASLLILTKAEHPRALDPQMIKDQELFSGMDVDIVLNVKAALEAGIKQAGPAGIVLVCGSIFVAAEARKYVSV